MDVRLLNTHLESMKESSEIRKSQLQQCFTQLKEWNDGRTLIVFGGDLNIRDNEVSTDFVLLTCHYFFPTGYR